LLALMARVPRVVIGPGASDSVLSAGEAGIVIDTGIAGIHDGGMALRMDDVPLPLRPTLAGPPDTADVVRALGALLPSRREAAAR
jgi:formylmethanofuran dehydrogenase subunit B